MKFSLKFKAYRFLYLLLLPFYLVLSACDQSPPEGKKYNSIDEIPALAFVQHGEVYNPESVIPPQCYTKTDSVNNPCYVCHQSYPQDRKRPNLMNDSGLQGSYEFSDVGLKNSWKNLFVDRRKAIDDISDDEINQWVTTDNYTPFIQQLEADKKWKGEIPKIDKLAYPEQAFDHQGLALDGSGWVAFNYKPFPSTFWPTNGSTGDVMIRLPQVFQQLNGGFNKDVYFSNLAMVEMVMKGLQSISSTELSEENVQTDLNGDGKIAGVVNQIVLQDDYFGDAKGIATDYMLYPEGTEFLHTVRYIAADENMKLYNAPRMKEVRYMKKIQHKSKNLLSSVYYREAKEKDEGNMPTTIQLGDRGIDNGFGWVINGYIEDANGQLRQQHDQELAFCNGCHKTIGSTYDQTFSFARKLDGRDGWGYINLTKLQDAPNHGESQGEYLTYMERVGGGDEFRQNQEMLDRWFNEDGSVNHKKVKSVTSLYDLIMPSAERALTLNKAYKTIVNEQSYIFGRDAVLKPATNVLQQVDDSIAPLQEAHRHHWDMRLDWARAASPQVSAVE